MKPKLFGGECFLYASIRTGFSLAGGGFLTVLGSCRQVHNIHQVRGAVLSNVSSSHPLIKSHSVTSFYFIMGSDPDDAEKERAREHRRKNPVGLVGVGCATHCLDEVRRGLRWAEQTSPETYTRALDKGVRNALLYESHEILIYLVTEESAPVDRITPQDLFFMDSLPLWSLVIKRGWDVNRRGLFVGRQKLRLLDLACKKFELVRWCLDHGAKLDDGKGPDSDHPPILQSVAGRGSVETYKFLQGARGSSWTARPTPRRPASMHQLL